MATPGPRSDPRAANPGLHPLQGTFIAFDFGERRIGVAVGETATGIASPIGAIDAVANDARFRAIAKLVDDKFGEGK